MSWRRFWILLDRLPSESAYKTERRDAIDLAELPPPEPGVYGPVSQLDVLTARVGDLLAHLLWMNADPGSRPPTPPRPYFQFGGNVRPISPAARAYLRYLQEHHGAAPPDGWEPEVI